MWVIRDAGCLGTLQHHPGQIALGHEHTEQNDQREGDYTAKDELCDDQTGALARFALEHELGLAAVDRLEGICVAACEDGGVAAAREENGDERAGKDDLRDGRCDIEHVRGDVPDGDQREGTCERDDGEGGQHDRLAHLGGVDVPHHLIGVVAQHRLGFELECATEGEELDLGRKLLVGLPLLDELDVDA